MSGSWLAQVLAGFENRSCGLLAPRCKRRDGGPDAGAHGRYPAGPPPTIVHRVEKELTLIREVDQAPYFQTVHDIVQFARSKGILCQGRGSAANSVVCYLLGITEVPPESIALIFERFISKERGEPPDIDVDFEHERREEVIQWNYDRYGRERAGLTATVIQAAGVEVAREVLAEAQGAIQPLVPYLDTLRWLLIAVALAGIAVTIHARIDDWKRGRR